MTDWGMSIFDDERDDVCEDTGVAPIYVFPERQPSAWVQGIRWRPVYPTLRQAERTVLIIGHEGISSTLARRLAAIDNINVIHTWDIHRRVVVPDFTALEHKFLPDIGLYPYPMGTTGAVKRDWSNSWSNQDEPSVYPGFKQWMVGRKIGARTAQLAKRKSAKAARKQTKRNRK